MYISDYSPDKIRRPNICLGCTKNGAFFSAASFKKNYFWCKQMFSPGILSLLKHTKKISNFPVQKWKYFAAKFRSERYGIDGVAVWVIICKWAQIVCNVYTNLICRAVGRSRKSKGGASTNSRTFPAKIWEDQSHYIVVAQGDIFMEQKMWFGLVLGRLAILEKKLGGPSNKNGRAFFSCFRGQKKILFENMVASALKSSIISL